MSLPLDWIYISGSLLRNKRAQGWIEINNSGQEFESISGHLGEPHVLCTIVTTFSVHD